ncbi:P13 family porin [Myxococcota bacterium]|nr:P13 family porin [Myxococcota bacterium]
MKRVVLFFMPFLMVSIISFASPAHAADLYAKETETFLINYQALSKDPSTALMLSLSLGFGSGHFYAQDSLRGGIFAGGQVLGAGMLLVGASMEDPASDAATILTMMGGVIFAGFRIVDIYMAPLSVERYNRKVAKRLHIRPLAMQAIPGNKEKIAWGLGLGFDFNGG